MSCVTVEIKPKQTELSWWTPRSVKLGQIVKDKQGTWFVTPPPHVNTHPDSLISFLIKVQSTDNQYPLFGCQFVRFPQLTDKGWDLSEVCLVIDSSNKRYYFTWYELISGVDTVAFEARIISSKRLLLQGVLIHPKRTTTFNPPDAWNWMYHGPVASFEYLEKNGFDLPLVGNGTTERRLIQEVLYSVPRNKTERALLQFHLVLTLQKETWPAGSRCARLKSELLDMGNPVVFNETLLGLVDRFGEVVTYGDGEVGETRLGEVDEDAVSPDERREIEWYSVPFTILK